MAVKLFEHCETVTLFVDDMYRLDLGPDHLPSPSVFLRLLKGTRLRQLKMVIPVRGGSETIIRCCHSQMPAMNASTEGSAMFLWSCPAPSGSRDRVKSSLLLCDGPVSLPATCQALG